MTLRDWLAWHPKTCVRPFIMGSLHVMPMDTVVLDKELWHLDDWLVSSVVSGPAVVLIPRNMEKEL